MKNFTVIFILMFSLTGCAQSDNFDVNSLYGCWVDSREENKPNTNENIFRPCDYKEFPSSRFRFKMELYENSECKWLYLAPNDGHYMKGGNWKFENNTLVIKNLEGRVVKSYLISKIDNNMLVLIKN